MSKLWIEKLMRALPCCGFSWSIRSFCIWFVLLPSPPTSLHSQSTCTVLFVCLQTFFMWISFLIWWKILIFPRLFLKCQLFAEERGRTQLITGRQFLQRLILLLLSSCKTSLRHPNCEYAARARHLLAEQISRLLHGVQRLLHTQLSRHCLNGGILGYGTAPSLLLHSPHTPPRWPFTTSGPMTSIHHPSTVAAAATILPVSSAVPSSAFHSSSAAVASQLLPMHSTVTTGLPAFTAHSSSFSSQPPPSFYQPHHHPRLPSNSLNSSCSSFTTGPNSGSTIPLPSHQLPSLQQLANHHHFHHHHHRQQQQQQTHLPWSVERPPPRLLDPSIIDSSIDVNATFPLFDCNLFDGGLNQCLNLHNQLCQFQVGFRTLSPCVFERN